MVPPLLNHITCNQREYTVRRTITLKEFNKSGGINKNIIRRGFARRSNPLPLDQMVTLHSRTVIPCSPIPYARAQPYHLGRGEGQGGIHVMIHIYAYCYITLNQLVITYRVGYHVRFRDISAQQRGRKYYIFPTSYKNKKIIFGLRPKPSTANFMQRNLLLFSRHLPCLLLRAITFYLNFEFTPTLWPFFARFAITSRHLWTIIIVDHGLYHCAYV